ncbi:MAG TPA: SRPBCC family protein [bacterium]|nr:SRPBCC family protein [bacterium]
MNLQRIALPLLLASLAACAAPQAKPAAPNQPSASQPPREQPMMVGTDIIVQVPQAQVWTLLTDVDNWGAWNSKVTKVSHGAGLNIGADLSYKWEEKSVTATLDDIKESERFVWKGTRTGDNVRMRWTLTGRPDNSTLVSLRAELKPGAGQTTIANASAEISAWIGSLQMALNKKAADIQAAAAAAAPAPKAKGKKKSHAKALAKAAPKATSGTAAAGVSAPAAASVSPAAAAAVSGQAAAK